MNFAQRNLARESIEGVGTVVPDGLELPADSVEGVLADIEHDTKAIDQTDAEGAVLAEDAQETDDQLTALDEADAAADSDDESADTMEAEEDMPDEAAEALDVAQESIRKRWNLGNRLSVAQESYGSKNRRKVARESLWDDIKAFLKRIWEWLKEQGRKVKDRWVKFQNQGKSIQKRSKAFDAAIRKMGQQKKDTISGSFVKQLSQGSTFVGDNTAKLNEELTGLRASQAAKETILDDIAKGVDTLESIGKAGLNGKLKAIDAEAKRPFKDGHQLVGGYAIKVEAGDADGEGMVVTTMSLIATEADVPSEVKTPNAGTLNNVNTFYNKLGKDIEQVAINYRKVDAAQTKYENAIEKLLSRLDKVKVDDNKELVEAVRGARTAINGINSLVGFLDRIAATVLKSLVSGVNGYLSAGIAAHGKQS